jgi:hypothetical protein
VFSAGKLNSDRVSDLDAEDFGCPPHEDADAAEVLLRLENKYPGAPRKASKSCTAFGQFTIYFAWFQGYQ